MLHADFSASWKATGEVFESREKFISANRDYPGNWKIEVKRLESTETGVVSVGFLHFEDKPDKYFATTFFEFKDDLIYLIEEYWAECENAPEWRDEYS